MLKCLSRQTETYPLERRRLLRLRRRRRFREELLLLRRRRDEEEEVLRLSSRPLVNRRRGTKNREKHEVVRSFGFVL